MTRATAAGLSYRPWAELMMRTFSVDVLCCPRCSGRLRLVALMTEPKELRSYPEGEKKAKKSKATKPEAEAAAAG